MNTSNLTLAFRNSLRHRTRSATALSAIAFSVVALLLAGGFIEWVFWATREAAIQNGLGHVRVVRTGYLDAGAADPRAFLLPDASPQLSALEAMPEVTVVAPRLNFSGLISRGDTTLPFLGEGVDPEKEKLVSRVLQIPHGEGLSGSDPHGIILGRGLASNLGVVPGDSVVLLATTTSGGVNAVEGRVRGIFVTEAKAYDDTAIRVPNSLAQTLLRVSGSHVWVLALDKTEHTTSVVNALRTRFADERLQFVPWFDLSDFYRKVVELLSRQMNAVRLVIALVIVLSICNMLIMNVLERTGEIGTMLAMGTTRRQVLNLFVTEGLLLGVVGGGLGVAVGTVLAHVISAIGIPMPPPPGGSAGYSAQILLTWQLAAGAFALAVATTLLASIYPAWKASRLPIVDALRHNH
jgi:putative ABC transport system permease protein